MPEARSRPLHGFTIVELLVVVAIIGVHTDIAIISPRQCLDRLDP